MEKLNENLNEYIKFGESIANERKIINTSSRRLSVKDIELFDIISKDEYFNNNRNMSKTAISRRSLSSDYYNNIISDFKIEENNLMDNVHENNSLDNNIECKFNKHLNSISGKETSGSFYNVIDKKLREMKENMLEKLEDYKSMLESKYDDHLDRIKMNVMRKAKRIKQVFNNNIQNSKSFPDYASLTPNNSPRKDYEYMRKYTMKNVSDKLDDIFDIHHKLELSIDKNFEILGNFLDNFDVYNDNPLHNFICDNADDIVNSWIFSRINFEKLNLIDLLENEKIPISLKNYISQDTVNKFSMISIKKSKSYDFEKKLLFDNHLILEKLCFINLDQNEFKKLFTQLSSIEGIKFEKLKEISLKYCNVENDSFIHVYPNNEIIKVKNCKINLHFVNVSRKFSKLKILSLKKSNFNNINFKSLTEDISNCKELLENLETLDLSHNNLSNCDLSSLSDNNTKFYSLQVLALNNNKIYKFKSQNIVCLPKVKLINLSSNNFTSGKDFYEIIERNKKMGTGIVVLFNKNFFMLNNIIQNKYYVDYLIETLPSFEFFVKKIDFSFIFNILNHNSIQYIQFNSNIQIALKKINLSNNSLESISITNFIKNNNGLLNLRILNISNNNINDTFLESYIKENFISLLENLENINISFNKITENSLMNIEEIFKNQKKLNQIKLSYNPIESSLIEYLTRLLDKEDDIFDEFIENISELKKEFKLYFSKTAESVVFNLSSSSIFNSKKNSKLLSSVFQFDKY